MTIDTMVKSSKGGYALVVASGGAVSSIAATGCIGLDIMGSPIETSGTLIFTLAEDLQALSLLSTTGLVARTAANTYIPRTITLGGTGNLTLTDGDGVLGNPTIDLSLTLSGLTSTVVGSITTSSDTIYSSADLKLSSGSGVISLITVGSNYVSLNNSTNGGEVRFYSPSGMLYTSLKIGSSPTNTTFLLPNSDGTANQFLQTNGSATLSFSSAVTSILLSTSSVGLSLGGTNPVTTTGTITVDLDADLNALAALSTTGIVARTGAATYVPRTITGTANTITLTNGSGVSGAPTITIANNAVMPGTGSMTVPIGTTAQRSGTPVNGMLRYNSDNTVPEMYVASAWTNINMTGATVFSVGISTSSVGLSLGGTNPVTTTGTITVDLDADLNALAALSTTGIVARTGAATYVPRTITGTANTITITNGDGVSGAPTITIASNTVMPGTGSMTVPIGTTAQRSGSPVNGMLRYNSDNTAPEIYTASAWTNINMTGATVVSVGISTSSGGLTLGGTNPVTTSGTITVDLDADLNALAALSTTGIVARTGSATYVPRTITGTTNTITITNGDGVAGVPTITIASNPVVPGTGSMTLPIGTTAQRSGSPVSGMTRYNSDTAYPEIYSGSAWSSINIGSQSNLIVVQKGGNDTTGARNGLPFLTIGAALAASGITSGDVVIVYPGTYSETGLTIPAGVSLVGVSMKNCVISTTSVSTTMITMGISTLLSNLTLLSSASGTTISTKGIEFPLNTASTALVTNVIVSMSATGGSISAVVTGVNFTSSGTSNPWSVSNCTIYLNCPGLTTGTVTGVLTGASSSSGILGSVVYAVTGGGASGYSITTNGGPCHADNCSLSATTAERNKISGNLSLYGCSINSTLLYQSDNGILAGNVSIAGNIISPLDTNGDIILKPNGTGSISIQSSGASSVPFRFYNSANTNYVGFRSGTLSTSTTFILPVADGTANQFLQTDGSANLTFSSITGTTNQISISGSGNRAIAIASNAVMPGTGSMTLPIGTTAQRSGTPVNGMIRYNSDTSYPEAYAASAWSHINIGSPRNLVIVHKGGNDTTGARNGLPFLTIGAALAVAQGGDIVLVYAGTYTETGLSVPDSVSLIGLSQYYCIIATTTASTTMITASSGCFISGFLLSASITNSTIAFTGINFPSDTFQQPSSPNATTSAAYASNIKISVTASGGATSASVTGIKFTSSSVSSYIKDTIIRINGSGLTNGTASGILTSGTVNQTDIHDSDISVTAGVGATGYAITTNTSGIVSAYNSILSATTSERNIIGGSISLYDTLDTNNIVHYRSGIGLDSASDLKFYNSTNANYVAFQPGTLSGNTTWTLPTADSAGVWMSNGSAVMSISNTPTLSTLTATTITGTTTTSGGNISLSGNNVSSTNTNGHVMLKPNGTGAVLVFGGTGELRIYNTALTQYSGFKSGSTSVSPMWTLPPADATGVWMSNGSAIMSISNTPTVTSLTATTLIGGNVSISGNTISTTDTNGNLVLSPNGTGDVRTDNISINGNTVSAIDTNGNVNVNANGTGSVVLTGNIVTVPTATNSVKGPSPGAGSNIAVGTAFQNTLGYDAVFTIMVQIAVLGGTGTILSGTGTSSSPTQQTLMSSTTVGVAAILLPISLYVPSLWYGKISTTGFTGVSVLGQTAMPV